MNNNLDNNINKISAVWADEILQDEENAPFKALVPQEARRKKIQFEIESAFHQFTSRVSKGTALLFDQLQLLISSQADQYDPAILDELSQMAFKPTNPEKINTQIQEGKSYKEIYNLSEKTLAACYQVAVELYNQQAYEEASDVFFVLTLLDPQNDSFWLGLGNSEFFRQRYEEALKAFALCAFANPNDPQCHFYAAHCYEKLGLIDLAINSLEIALLVIRSDSSLSEWENPVSDYLTILTHPE